MNADERAGKNHRGSRASATVDILSRRRAGHDQTRQSGWSSITIRPTPTTTKCPMHIELTSILDQFDAVQARVHRLADNLTEMRWAERADPARWSVAECVAHLNLTGRAYLPLLWEALEEASNRDEPPPARYRRDPLGWMLSLAMGPVPRIGRFRLGAVRTIPEFVPARGLPRAQVVAEFDRIQEEQAGIVREADGNPINRVWVISPFDRRLRYNLYSTFVILPKHQRRHVVQAERIWQ